MAQEQRLAPNLRTMRVLEILGNSDRAMTATEINQQMGLPKQTVHRLCNTLIDEGYLVKEAGGKRLRPARRLRQMASGILAASQIHIARHQILLDVARQVEETVNFVVPEDKGMRYLDRVETAWAFRIQLPIGTRVPFHCTASGKTFLASLPTSSREAMVASLTLPPLTRNTLVKPADLLRELDLIAERGFASDNEEFVEGMVAVAVPVTDLEGRFLAALAFHGPTQRISMDRAIQRVDVLTDGARRLRTALFD